MARADVLPIPSCRECGLESAGRCRHCKRHLCMDHFPREEHAPCAARVRRVHARALCYVCAAPVQPQQWSASVFAHYSDSCRCVGCRRYICDDLHTILHEEAVEIVQDGLRSNRYHIVRRHCSVCARLQRVGGLRGLARLGVGVVGGLTAVVLVLLENPHLLAR